MKVYLLLGFCSTMQVQNVIEDDFFNYISKWGKNYKTLKEFIMRKAHFDEVSVQIKTHNKSGKSNYQMGHNFMSDWSSEEYTRFLGEEGKCTVKQVVEHKPSMIEVDESVDWRLKGVVDKVGNQG